MNSIMSGILAVSVLFTAVIADADAAVFYIVPAEEGGFRPEVSLEYSTFTPDAHEVSVTALKKAAESFHDSVKHFLGGKPPADRVAPLWIVPAVLIETGDGAAVEQLLPPDMKLVPGFTTLPELPAGETAPDGAMSGKGNRRPGWGLEAVGAPEMWRRGLTGEGRLICILDTGVDGDHPLFAGRWRGIEPGVAPEEAWFAADGSVFPYDSDQLGTMAAGICLGAGNGDTTGVATAAQWIAAKVLGRHAVDLLEALQWAADPDGDPKTADDVPDAVNCAFRTSEACPGLLGEAIANLEFAGPAVFFSAGNEGPDPGSVTPPADLVIGSKQVWATGAVDSTLAAALFSSRGPSPCDTSAIKPDAVAPGTGIATAQPGGGETMYTGTGASASFVSGMAALLRHAAPYLTAVQLRDILAFTAVDLGAPGEDQVYGSGLISGPAAADLVQGGIGAIEGSLHDRATGLPVADALISLDDGGQETVTNTDGGFCLTASAGEDTLSILKFGYRSMKEYVSVVAEDTTMLAITIPQLPEVRLDGKVSNAGTGDGLFAELEFSFEFAGELVPCGKTFSDSGAGHYSIDLLEGAYTITGTPELPFSLFEACGVHVDSAGPNEVDFPVDIASVMLVDGDGGDGYEIYFHEPMDSLKLDYRTWNKSIHGSPAGAIGGTPPAILLWMTGDLEDAALTPEEDAACAAFLESGGKCLFTGQNFAEYLAGSGSAVIDSLLRIGHAGNTDIHFITGIPEDTLGAALPLIATAGSGPPANQDSEDILDAGPGGAVPFLEYAGGSDAAVHLSLPGGGRIVFLGFGFEGVHETAGAVGRVELLQVLLGWLRTGTGIGGPEEPSVLSPRRVALTASPNPFNPRTRLVFVLKTRADTVLDIFDLRGRLVRRLIEEELPAGKHAISWDGKTASGNTAASGVYAAKLTFNGCTEKVVLVLLK